MLDFGSGAGHDAIGALARSLLGLEVTSDAEAARTAIAAALSSDLVARDDAVFLHDMLDLPQPPELRGLYEAMDGTTRSRGNTGCSPYSSGRAGNNRVCWSSKTCIGPINRRSDTSPS